jgi:class 3 adenylate cyclase
MRGLIIHSVVFGVVNALLIGIWLLTTGTNDILNNATSDPLQAFRDGMWPLAVIAGWGGGLAIHAVVVITSVPGKVVKKKTKHAPPVPPAVPATPKVPDLSARDLGQHAVRTAMGLVESFANKASTPKPARAAGREWITAMFTDVVGSTELAERLGDAAWHHMLAEHRTLVRGCVDEHDGVEIGTQGDGFLLRFPSPDAAVGCAIAIQREMAGRRESGAFAPELRVGCHAGEAVADDNDLVGRVINLASRVTSAAAPSEILVTEPVADHLSPGISIADRGLVPLKGFTQPRHLLAIEWRVVDHDQPSNPILRADPGL